MCYFGQHSVATSRLACQSIIYSHPDQTDDHQQKEARFTICSGRDVFSWAPFIHQLTVLEDSCFEYYYQLHSHFEQMQQRHSNCYIYYSVYYSKPPSSNFCSLQALQAASNGSNYSADLFDWLGCQVIWIQANWVVSYC